MEGGIGGKGAEVGGQGKGGRGEGAAQNNELHPKGTIALAIRAIIKAIRTNYMRSSQSLICQNINSIPKTARDQRRQQERDSQVSKSSRNGYNFAKSALARLSRYSLLEPRGKSAGLGLGGGWSAVAFFCF